MTTAESSSSSSSSSSYEFFVQSHEHQLNFLQIPSIFFPSIYEQLQLLLKGDIPFDHPKVVSGDAAEEEDVGAILVVPHLCSWSMLRRNSSEGMWDAIKDMLKKKNSSGTLKRIANELDITIPHGVEQSDDTAKDDDDNDDDVWLNRICSHEEIWRHVILYRSSRIPNEVDVRGALPAWPWFPQKEYDGDDDDEADLSGPFPFQYDPGDDRNKGTYSLVASGPSSIIDCSLYYVNPGVRIDGTRLPTVDLVPPYSVQQQSSASSNLLRSIRYAALFQHGQGMDHCIRQVKQLYANFVHEMHLKRQEKQSNSNASVFPLPPPPQSRTFMAANSRDGDSTSYRWKVFTDTNDPMGLGHPEAGLDPSRYQLVSTMEEADIIFSYQSLFSSLTIRAKWEGEKISNESKQHTKLVNQFPYEGAFCQKDHLARELLQQHGLPRPSWALESYDLDVHLGYMVGSAWFQHDNHNQDESKGLPQDETLAATWPLWIVKPSRGTQSKGHVVTSSLAHILRLLDAEQGRNNSGRVAQRYVERPLCFPDGGRKLDCRVLVLWGEQGSLYAHKRYYFRIAAEPHSISQGAKDWKNSDVVLTAMHLVDENKRLERQHQTANPEIPISDTATDRMLLPVDRKTISLLEEAYDFVWSTEVEPKIHDMIRELFVGMREAYPTMLESQQSRAIYGVDVMFEMTGDDDSISYSNKGSIEIQPKLTEVTYCPANNAICEAYERDDDLYRNYTTEVFDCLFLNEISDSFVRIL